MRTTARAVIIRDDEILVIVRERFDNVLGFMRYYSIPGGGIEPDESSEEAVVRELHEEFLVDAKVERFLGVVHLPKQHTGERRYQKRSHYFYLCSGVTGLPTVNPEAPEMTLRLPGDITFEAAWIPVQTPIEEFHPDYASVMAWVQLHQGKLEKVETFEIDVAATVRR